MSTKVTSNPGVLAELWFGILLAPIAALSQLEANYALVLRACQSGREWPLHLVSGIALVMTLIGGLLAFRNRPSETAARERVRPSITFMSSLGMLISGLMLLVIIAQWIAVFVFGPCHRWD